MSVNRPLTNFLNIAKRSQSLRYGLTYLRQENSHKISLIIVTSTASSNTKKRVKTYAAHYEINYFEINEEEITSFVRPTNIKVIAVQNNEIARKLLMLRKDGDNDEKYEKNSKCRKK